MAIPKVPPSNSTLKARADFAVKCRGWLRTLEEQKARAIDMIEDAREMSRRAAIMRTSCRPPIVP